MLIVPGYKESRRPAPASDGRITLNGRAAALVSGESMRNAEAKPGNELSRAGDAVAGIGLAQLREHNETVALARFADAEKGIQDLREAQARRIGREALDGEDGLAPGVRGSVNAGLSKLHADLARNLNEAQKRLFESAFRQRARWLGDWAERHEAEQRKAWVASTEDEAMARFGARGVAGHTDVKEVYGSRDNIDFVMRSRGKREGWDEATLKTATNERLTRHLYAPILDDMIGKGDFKQARGFLKQFRDDIGPETAGTFETAIRDKAEALEAKARAEAERARARAEKAAVAGAVTDILGGVRDFATLEEQRETAFARTARIAEPAVRDKARAEIKREMAWREDRRDAATAREIHRYRELARNQKWTPCQAAEQVEKADISDAAKEKLWKDYDGKAERATPQNKAALAELRRQIDLGPEGGGLDRKDADAIDAYALRHDLTYEQGRKAHAYAEQGGAAGELTQTRINRAFRVLFPQGTPSAMPADLYDLVASELEPGKPVTDAQVRRIVARLYTEGETDGSGWFSDEETYTDAKRHDRAGEWEPDDTIVPEADRARIEKLLTDNGVTPTPARVRRLYREETGGRK